MSAIAISLLGSGACRIVHEESGTEIRSSVSPVYGGAGGTFSSTDLLAAALGSCIATNLEPVAIRHGIPLESIRLMVTKALSTTPKRIASLGVRVDLPAGLAPDLVARLNRAADHCLVHQSLAPDLSVTIELVPAAP